MSGTVFRAPSAYRCLRPSVSPTVSTALRQIHANAHAGKNPERVAAGLKAASNNPNLAESKRDDARQRLEEMSGKGQRTSRQTAGGAGGVAAQDDDTGDQHQHHVMGGYKATLKNPNVSDAAKQHAEQVLKGKE